MLKNEISVCFLQVANIIIPALLIYPIYRCLPKYFDFDDFIVISECSVAVLFLISYL